MGVGWCWLVVLSVFNACGQGVYVQLAWQAGAEHCCWHCRPSFPFAWLILWCPPSVGAAATLCCVLLMPHQGANSYAGHDQHRHVAPDFHTVAVSAVLPTVVLVLLPVLTHVLRGFCCCKETPQAGGLPQLLNVDWVSAVNVCARRHHSGSDRDRSIHRRTSSYFGLFQI